MTHRTFSLAFIYAAIVVLLMTFQPAAPRAAAQTGEGTPNPYIDALGTQAALNTQATLAAYDQQQSAAGAANSAAAAQAQAQAAAAYAAQMQAQAAYTAQQATQQAGVQQAALAAAQSTADAAAQLATAVAAETRTANEQRVTATAQALVVKATNAAIASEATRQSIVADATRAAVDAQRRDNEAIAASVAQSVQATATAIAEQAAREQHFADVGLLITSAVSVVAGVAALLLIGKFALGLWRSRALNPSPGPVEPLPVAPVASEAAASVVDAATGVVGSRLAPVEYNDDPAALDNLLRSLYGIK